MKRSEMVEMLATFLDHDYVEDADQIIQFLESNGMLPPEYVVDYSPMITTNAWEPEDLSLSTIDTDKAINELLTNLDNDKETKDVLTKLVPDGVKLK